MLMLKGGQEQILGSITTNTKGVNPASTEDLSLTCFVNASQRHIWPRLTSPSTGGHCCQGHQPLGRRGDEGVQVLRSCKRITAQRKPLP